MTATRSIVSNRLVAIVLATALALGLATGAAAQSAAWLDAPPRPFNVPGAPIPAAPTNVLTQDGRCASQERAAAGPEESRLAAASWRLEQFWPTQRASDVAVVLATAGYDGMCRPLTFNGFAFVGGAYAGTLAPEPMNSRTDGVLSEPPTVGADRRVVASFTRYAPTDPLCCPSRGRTRVTYRIATAPAGATLAPEQIVAVPAAPAAAPPAAPTTPQPTARPAVPTQLPRTGSPPALLLIPALALLGFGRALARRDW